MNAALLRALFHLDVPLIEKIVRPILVYLFLIAGFRFAGKRVQAQLNPFDLVVLLTISNTVQNAIIGSDNSLLGGLIGASTLLVVNYVVVRFLFSHERLDRIIEGDPVALIQNGQLQIDRLKKELITIAELEEAARKQGFESLASIDRAVVEPGGTFSFFKTQAAPEDTRHQELILRLEAIARDVAKLRNA